MDTLDYKSSFEQLPSLVILLDLNFNILAVSNAYLKATKTVREYIMGQNLFDVFPDNPDDTTADGEYNIRASLNRVILNKITDKIAVVKYDIPKPAIEGGGFILKYWRPVHTPVFDEFNNLKYIIQLVEDVTENETLVTLLASEKKLLKQVADSEKRYSMLLMKSPFAFAVFKGKEMVITLANDSIKKIWGKGFEVEGRPLFDLLPELKDSPFPGLINEVYTTGIPFYGDELLAQLLRKDKLENSYFNFIYQPYLEADETISGVTIIFYEVTSQVLLKQAIAEQLKSEKKALKRIEESNTRYYTMLMQSPFAFCIMKGNDLVITLANDKIKSIWKKGANVEGKPLLEVLPELTNQPFPDMLREVYTTGNPIYANEILVTFMNNGKIEDRYFNIVFQPHHEADQTISGVITIAYEVTEMVLARQKVEESEHRFQGAVEAVQGILWTTNSDGEVEDVQQAWAKLSGQTKEEYKGNGWANAIHPEDKTYTLIAWNKAVIAKTKFICEHRIKLKDGSWGQFLVRAIPLFNPDGTVREWVGVHLDISIRRRAEEAIKESEKKFKQLVDSMPQKISQSDAIGNVIFLNQQWLNDTGLCFEELNDFKWIKALHPNDMENVVRNWKTAVDTGNMFDMECRILNKRGEYIWNLSRAVPLKNEQGEITMWVGSNTDIHEQKEQKMFLEKAVKERTKALDESNKILVFQNKEQQNRAQDLIILSGNLKIQQQELSKANFLLTKQEEDVKVINSQLYQLNRELEQRVDSRTKALEVSEHRFRSMMETIPQIAWTNTIKLEVTFYNQRWYDYTGLNFEQTKLSGWQKVVYPDDLQDTLQQFRNILKTMEGGGFQARLQSSDNQYRWHLIRLMPIRDEAGQMQLWVGTATDIQELKLLQQQKDDFISIASHELKTPITSLKLSLQLLNELKLSLPTPLVPNLIIQANRSLDKFTLLIDDLLNSSRANEGQLHLNKTKFILSKIIDDCCSYVRIEGIYTIKTVGDMEVEVYADAKKIEQIMINFVNNSIKYAPKSKEIYISIETLNDMVKVSVADKGPGISKENLQHLFDRYYRVESNGINYAAGLGLGLYISSEIVKKHGGQIGVNSEIGRGSTFWFTLPLIA